MSKIVKTTKKPTKRAPKITLSPIERIIKNAADQYTFGGYGSTEYTYDTDYNCDDYCCGDYCRCGKIVNAKITEVHIDYIFRNLTDGSNDAILNYCVDRLLRLSGITNTDNWEVDVRGGYYGDEVCGVTLDRAIDDKFDQSIQSLVDLSDAGRIKKVLELEYGFVLPRLKQATQAKIVKAKMVDVKLFNDTYAKKVSQETVDYYQDYKLPRAICTEDEGDLFDVVDGYHRMLSAHKQNLTTVSVIVLS